MKSTAAQPAAESKARPRLLTEEYDSDDESAIRSPEDLFRRFGGVHVRGGSVPLAAPLELGAARRRRRGCGLAIATPVLTVVALAVAFPAVWRTAKPLVRVAAYPVGAVLIVIFAAALLVDLHARCCQCRSGDEARAATFLPNGQDEAF